MVDRRALVAKRNADEVIERALVADLDALWERAWRGGVFDSALFDAFLPGIIERYGLAFGEVAAQWFEALIGSQATIAAPVGRAAVNSARWVLAPYRDAAAGVAAGVARDRLMASMVRHAKRAGRDTLHLSVRATPGVLYARRLSGAENCDFCVVLASRGPVYGTALKAGEPGNRFHDGCDCDIVPVRGRWMPDSGNPRGVSWVGESPGYDFEKLYVAEYKPYWAKNDTIDDVVAKRGKARAAQRTPGKPGRPKGAKNKPKLGGAGGAGKPPTRKSSASGAFDRDKNLVPRVKPSKQGTITVEQGASTDDVELRVGRILAERGMNVTHRAVVNIDRHKNPDLGIDGEIWEIKSPKGSSEKNTINNQFRRGKKQAEYIVLNLARCGIPDHIAIQQAERRFFGTFQFKKMIIIDKSEEVYHYIL